VRGPWTHIGRLWSNGEPFIVIDAERRGAWRGSSGNDFERVVTLGYDDTTLTVGDATAAVVGADGEVGDEGWAEVFRSVHGAIAFVQAIGPEYARALDAALDHPDMDDHAGGEVAVATGELAVFTSALDGAGDQSSALSPERPGPAPVVKGAPSSEAEPGLLISAGDTATFQLKVRWCTELDDESYFARWLLIPAGTGSGHEPGR
jgi:hypothetical protein